MPKNSRQDRRKKNRRKLSSRDVRNIQKRYPDSETVTSISKHPGPGEESPMDGRFGVPRKEKLGV